jgi:hypothetical protein
MASNGLQYFTTYLQSHEERYAKFRDEAYQELILQKKMDAEYREALREREKVLQDAINKARKGEEEGINKLELIKEGRALNQAIISSQNEGRDSRLKIREGLQGQLEVPQAAKTKLAESANTLATSGGLIVDPAGVKALIEGQVTDVAASIKGGTRSAASAAQQLWKQLKTDKTWDRLTTADKDALEQSITAQFGLDAVNIGGVSGDALLDTPQDILIKKEEDALLAQEGGAYGVSALRQLLAELEALKKEGSPEAIAAKQAEIDAALAPEKAQLDKIREELSKPPVPFQPAEADVRKRAAEKYGFESPGFMKEQFARDILGTDKEKLLHYDAIQAAKQGKIKLNPSAVTAAQLFINNYVPLDVSKAERRQAAIDMAVKFSDGDKKKRDEFLIAFHKIQMEGSDERTGPSEILPEPVPALVEPQRLGDADKLPGPGRLKGGGREERLAEVERDIGVRQAITDRMVDLVKQKDALDKIGIANFTPEQEQKYDDLMAGMDTLRTEYNKPQYDPAIFAAERADLRRALFPVYSKPLNEMLEAERLKLAQGQEEFPSGFDVPPRRVSSKAPVATKPSTDTALKRLQQLTIEDLFKSDI